MQELQAVSNLARRVNSPYKGRNSPLRGASGRNSPVCPRTRATTEHGPRAELVGGAASISPRVARLSQRFVAGLCLSSSIGLIVNIDCPSPDLLTLQWTSLITKDAKVHVFCCGCLLTVLLQHICSALFVHQTMHHGNYHWLLLLQETDLAFLQPSPIILARYSWVDPY